MQDTEEYRVVETEHEGKPAYVVEQTNTETLSGWLMIFRSEHKSAAMDKFRTCVRARDQRRAREPKVLITSEKA